MEFRVVRDLGLFLQVERLSRAARDGRTTKLDWKSRVRRRNRSERDLGVGMFDIVSLHIPAETKLNAESVPLNRPTGTMGVGGAQESFTLVSIALLLLRCKVFFFFFFYLNRGRWAGRKVAVG